MRYRYPNKWNLIRHPFLSDDLPFPSLIRCEFCDQTGTIYRRGEADTCPMCDGTAGFPSLMTTKRRYRITLNHGNAA